MADVRDQILEAATALWSEKGYQQATMRELARRLGMGVSSLYLHFRSKEEIVQYLYVRVNQQALDEWRQQSHHGLGESFQNFMLLKLQRLDPHRSCLAAIMREAVDPDSSLNPMSADSKGVLSQNLTFFSELVSQHTRSDKAQALRLARSIWLAHLGVILYWLHDRSTGWEGSRQLIGRLADMMGMLPVLNRLPILSSLMDIASNLFDKPASTVSPDPAATTEAPLKEYDVVVVGGGPIGCIYASFLKQTRPRTRILVLEKDPEPGHKIGESTLSGFCKALRTLGIGKDVMQRMFYAKNGLGFFHVDESVKDIRHASEYILETFDQTWQVERRVLDSLCIANARRLGVEIIQGATVSLKDCQLGTPSSIVSYQIGSHRYRIRCSLLADASGPAGLIARGRGLWTDEGSSFQTSSVWTYYTGVRPLGAYDGWPNHAQFPRDEYTQHLCFRQGWMWYIPLVSWQSAPTVNLNRGVERLLRTGRSLPSRERLAEDYGCPTSPLLSVGITVRSDRDVDFREDAGAAFNAYAERYPAIRQVLSGGHQESDVYGSGHTWGSRQNFRGHSRQVAGDGWLLIGDAAFFVDPLISPGLTGGTAQAYFAAQESARALDAGTTRREFFTAYEGFVHRLHEALERDNQLVYMSFNHPQAIELIQRYQEIDSRRHFLQYANQDYSLSDTNVWGILEPSYQELQLKIWAMMREEEQRVGAEVPIDEQSPRDYKRMVSVLVELLGSYVDGHRDLTPYARANRRQAGAAC